MSDHEPWTDEERRWISRAKRLFMEKPENVLLYTTDGEISACKDGVSSMDINTHIAPDAISIGCVLTDIHDDMGHGA